MTVRRVVLTGVAGGIGRATAGVFLAAGWNVIGIDTRPRPDLPELEAFFQVDVSDAERFAAVLSDIASGPTVHALVNNAGTSQNVRIADMSVQEWDRVMDTNLRSAFISIRALTGTLSTGLGAIVNVSSVHAIATTPCVSAYAASKGAIVSFTRAVALELAEVGIRANAVLPGAVHTPMLLAGLARSTLGAEVALAHIERNTPLGRVAAPEEIAQAIVFLCDSRMSGFMTGQTLVIDGGATIQLATETRTDTAGSADGKQ